MELEGVVQNGVIVPDDPAALSEGTRVRISQAPVGQSAKAQTENDVQRFQILAQRWKQETAHVSNVGKRALHPAYQEIIGMGSAAIPLILAELKRDPDDWFWALHAITGANPIPEESRGNLRRMADAWLEWGSGHGYQT